MSSPLFSAVEYFFGSLYEDVVDVSEDEMVREYDYDVAADSIEEIFENRVKSRMSKTIRDGEVYADGPEDFMLSFKLTIPHKDILKEIADSYTSEFEWAINQGEEPLKDALNTLYLDPKVNNLFEGFVKKYLNDRDVKAKFKSLDEAAGDEYEILDVEFDDDNGRGQVEVTVDITSPRKNPRRANSLSSTHQGESPVSRKLTASDRKNLIRLASSLPKGDKQRLAILTGLKSASMKTSNRKKTAVTAEDDYGNEILDLEERVRDTIKELESLLKRSKDFQKRLESGRVKGGDYFLDFTPAMDEGYDRTGPKEITIVD